MQIARNKSFHGLRIPGIPRMFEWYRIAKVLSMLEISLLILLILSVPFIGLLEQDQNFSAIDKRNLVVAIGCSTVIALILRSVVLRYFSSKNLKLMYCSKKGNKLFDISFGKQIANVEMMTTSRRHDSLSSREAIKSGGIFACTGFAVVEDISSVNSKLDTMVVVLRLVQDDKHSEFKWMYFDARNLVKMHKVDQLDYRLFIINESYKESDQCFIKLCASCTESGSDLEKHLGNLRALMKKHIDSMEINF